MGGDRFDWTVSGGIPVSRALQARRVEPAQAGTSVLFRSATVTWDSTSPRIRMSQDLEAAVHKITGQAQQPEFLLHTGDISHLSRPEEFDNVDQILKGLGGKHVFFVPGEHDVLDDDGKSYLERYGKGAKGSGWYSFDQRGVHFIGLVNVMNLKAGGQSWPGADQMKEMT